MFQYIVLDSGVIIKGDGNNLYKLSDNVVTVSEVLDEIRDEKARASLEQLPYELKTMSPSKESLMHVMQFAKSTGDFAVLSVTDLKLIALAHTLHVSLKKTDNSVKPKTSNDSPSFGSCWEAIEEISNSNQTISNEDVISVDESGTETTQSQPLPVDLQPQKEQRSNTLLDFNVNEEQLDPDGKPTSPFQSMSPPSSSFNDDTYPGLSIDDDIGWISKDNIHNQQIGIVTDKQRKDDHVVCMTTDFAMQNVLIQLGIRIASSNGMMIKSVKHWVLRCNGCYKIHYDMQRLFCSKCGLNYLSKVGCHIDETTGELKLHLKKNFHHNLRGKKYSLPSPDKRDRFEGDLLLREDQLFSGIWRQKSHTIRKNIQSAFGEDITNDVGISINKGLRVAVGYGAKNPNAERGRERRGKLKSK